MDAHQEMIAALLGDEPPLQPMTPVQLAMTCLAHALFAGPSNNRAGDIRAAIVTLFGAEIDAELSRKFSKTPNVDMGQRQPGDDAG